MALWFRMGSLCTNSTEAYSLVNLPAEFPGLCSLPLTFASERNSKCHSLSSRLAQIAGENMLGPGRQSHSTGLRTEHPTLV